MLAGPGTHLPQGAESRQKTRPAVFAIIGDRTKHRIGDFRPVQAIDLLVAADFFRAEVERIGRSKRSELRHVRAWRRGRAAATNDREVGEFHRESQPGCDTLYPERQIMA